MPDEPDEKEVKKLVDKLKKDADAFKKSAEELKKMTRDVGKYQRMMEMMSKVIGNQEAAIKTVVKTIK